MFVLPSLAAALLLLSSTSAAPIEPQLDARSSHGVSSRSFISARAFLAKVGALQPRWLPFLPVPDNYWTNPDILYYWQTQIEAFENVRVLGPRQPQISPVLSSANLSALMASRPEPTAPDGLINTIGRGQDPCITSVTTPTGQVYYSTDSDYINRLQLRSSQSLSTVNQAARKTVSISGGIIVTAAPDLARWSLDRWIYTISSVRYDQISSVVSASSDPMGRWGSQGLITYQGTPISGFDSHIFTHPNGKRYIIWSNHATLLMAEMLTSTTVGKPNAVSSMMGEPANSKNFWNNEAPSTVIAPNVNGSSTINLVFSTGDFRTPNYTTRVLTSDASSDPMKPRSWTLQRTPILASDASRSVYGPGSGSFFDCGARKCFAYGAWAQANTIDEGNAPRTVRIQHVDFDASGLILPMKPIKPTRLTL